MPGLNLIYAHLNRLIQDTDASVLLIVGPGTRRPASWLDCTWRARWADSTAGPVAGRRRGGPPGPAVLAGRSGRRATVSRARPARSRKAANWATAWPTPTGRPWTIPDLLAPASSGDGEAETGPLAAAWHSNKFLYPATSGAVLPILHLNGYKLSGPTILGRMSDAELEHLFIGYGHQVRIVSRRRPAQVHPADVADAGLGLRARSAASRNSRAIRHPEELKPAWPMIILRTPKGWTVPEGAGRPAHREDLPLAPGAHHGPGREPQAPRRS